MRWIGPKDCGGSEGTDQRMSRVRPGGIAIALIVLGFVLSAFDAFAQDVRVQAGRGPHYIGEMIDIQVIATDFSDDAPPEIEAGEVAQGQLRYAGVSDSTSTSITIVNGRMSRVKEVSYVYRYAFVATETGRVVIPSFRVHQGNLSRETRPFELQIETVPKTGLVRLSVALPEGPIFVGQKVPVEITLSIDREAQRDLLSYQATVPLFDLPSLRFLDTPIADPDTQLEIETAAGTLRLPATSAEERVGGRPTLVVRARRTMIPLAAEEIRASAARVVIERGTRFRRDLFNQRQATASQRVMAEDEAIRIEVIEVPREGRPPSFAGAVGTGFSLEVSADRSVVQVGEPILLAFHLRGDGDLSSASLPDLSAVGLFDPQKFRLPEDPPAGLVDDEGKHFEASVRVLDAEVKEIPALAYSWFDAETRNFETTASRPIALSVGAAEMIGADDVARREGSEPEGEDLAGGLSGEEKPSEGDVVRGTSFVMSGANLAVERDATRVLGGRAKLGIAPVVVPGLYLAGAGLLVLAVLARRRRTADPRQRLRAEAFARARAAIETAAGAGDSGSAALGRALREFVAALPEEAGEEIDDLLAECDALEFAPSGMNSALPGALVDRARQVLAARRSRSMDRAGNGERG